MGTTAQEQLSLLDQERQRRPGETDADLVATIARRTIKELSEKPPVSLEVVAAYRGIDEIRQERLPNAGSLTPEGNRLVMRLNRGDSRRRQRFTGFHEVSHTFQPGYRDQVQNRCEPRYRLSSALGAEALSDLGAAELLLPEIYFGSDVGGATFGIESVLDLAGLYEASIQATSYRFAAFWPEPTLVVALEPGVRKAELGDPFSTPRLRVQSVWAASGDWPFVPANKSADDDGPLADAFESERPISARTTLEELTGSNSTPLEVSAKSFRYRGSDGELRRRVLALYRRSITGRTRRS